MAKMLVVGEDLCFITRRIIICVCEDVGMSDPKTLTVAVSLLNAVRMPEARIILAQAAIYMACTPKSNIYM